MTLTVTQKLEIRYDCLRIAKDLVISRHPSPHRVDKPISDAAKDIVEVAKILEEYSLKEV